MLRNFFANSNDSEYFDSIADRGAISDAAFFHEYYASSDVALETCVRVRRVLCEQLRMCNTQPHDNVALVFDDIDIGEVCFELAMEFSVKFSKADIQRIDGTVDSLIRLIQCQLKRHD